MAIATINPATGETLKTFTPLTDAEIEDKLALAQSTFEQYRHTTFAQRSQWLNQASSHYLCPTKPVVKPSSNDFRKRYSQICPDYDHRNGQDSAKCDRRSGKMR